MSCDKVAGLLLAAGLGSRFGGAKLEADLDGRPLGLHAAEALAQVTAQNIAITSRISSLNQYFIDHNYQIIENSSPELGLSYSIRLGIEALEATDADAALICLADMPLVTPSLINALIEAGRGNDDVIASICGGVRSPPALFPRRFWPELRVLSGDSGAKSLIRDALVVEMPREMARDVDTPADLTAILKR